MKLAFPKFFIVFFTCFYCLIFSQNIEPKPKILYPVYDKANLLNSEEKNKLNEKLIKYSDSTSTEIVVIILPNTGGEDINFLAAQYGEKWGIGQKHINNGVVFLISKEDRKMSIQQGRAVEQYITASTAGQILDYIVAPYFRKGFWYKGIDSGTDAIIENLQGKFKINDQNTDKPNHLYTLLILAIIIVLIIVIMNQSGKGGKKHNDENDEDIVISRSGKSAFPIIFFPGSFGSGRGSSGGGFGGFGGGGSFGGGGASGSW